MISPKMFPSLLHCSITVSLMPFGKQGKLAWSLNKFGESCVGHIKCKHFIILSEPRAKKSVNKVKELGLDSEKNK